MEGKTAASGKKSYPSGGGGVQRNRSRVVWGEKNDGWRCEEREMRKGGKADRWEDREVW